MHYRFLLVLTLTLFLTACGGQLDADSGVSGVWDGAVTETGAPITLELTQSGTHLSGTLTANGETVVMDGTVARNLISLSYQETEDSIQIEASISGDTMQGTLAVTTAGETVASAFTAAR